MQTQYNLKCRTEWSIIFLNIFHIMMASNSLPFAKLEGKKNYREWAKNMEYYLGMDDLWDCTQRALAADANATAKK